MIEDHYAPQASSMPSQWQHVLKHGETFALFDHFGDSNGHSHGAQGLYHEDTRFVSRLELRINGAQLCRRAGQTVASDASRRVGAVEVIQDTSGHGGSYEIEAV